LISWERERNEERGEEEDSRLVPYRRKLNLKRRLRGLIHRDQRLNRVKESIVKLPLLFRVDLKGSAAKRGEREARKRGEWLREETES